MSAAAAAGARARREHEAAEAARMVAVVGPTASGKSGLALALAERFGGEILNTDAMQVYRHFDVGTAKPGPAERARVVHHLLDVVDPDEPYSAGAYVRDVRAIVARLRGQGRLPVLCGGTGLYFRALLQGLADIPDVPPEVRRAVRARLEERGTAACHGELAAVDPVTAACVHPNDAARIARGLEVFQATGRPLSAYQQERPFRAGTSGVLSVGYAWERGALYERIDRRVREMLARGWIEEVEAILDMGYGPELKPFRSIGYQEVVEVVLGRRLREGLAEAIALRTRRYAKRQCTWFRQHPDICWFPAGDEAAALERVRIFLKTGR